MFEKVTKNNFIMRNRSSLYKKIVNNVENDKKDQNMLASGSTIATIKKWEYQNKGKIIVNDTESKLNENINRK
jgi:G:T-mismatch repair DNA endonuclease (very short patch repair protein)